MTFRLGLTGSIGMGKSTTAKMFADEGCDVWDADRAVHRLYEPGGAAVEQLGAAFPGVIVDGAVDRDQLKTHLAKHPGDFKQLEEIVHPLVGADRANFIANAKSDILVFDIPLLFETGGNKNMDAVICVSVPPDIQRSRVLARGTMTEDQFIQILAKQMPASEKCAQSDYVIMTDTLDHAREQVRAVIQDIKSRL